MHMKAIVRGAQCATKIRKYDIALKWIEHGLLEEPEHAELLKLRQETELLKVGIMIMTSTVSIPQLTSDCSELKLSLAMK